MNQKIIIVIGLLAVLLVSGCVGQPPADGEERPGLFGNLFKKAEPINKPFVTGTEALKFFFEENAPPESSLSSESFPLIVIAENRGAVKVPANGLVLTLDNPTLWRFDKTATWHNAADIEPRIVTIGGVALPGGKEAIELGDAKYKYAPVEKKSDYISVIACYPYQTILQSSICAATRGGACDPKAPKTFYSSSAPVEITDFKQISAKRRGPDNYDITISFKIKNSGRGGTYIGKSCNKISEIDRGEISSFAIDFAGRRYGHCVPDTFYADKEGREYTCALTDADITDNSEGPIIIKLNYLYKDSFKTSIGIIPAK